MKIVKLNRRYKQFKDHGHTVALRFANGHTQDSIDVEKACRARLKGHGWMREHDWYGYYGSKSGRYDVRPYWITFRNEVDLTLVLLSANLTQNG